MLGRRGRRGHHDDCTQILSAYLPPWWAFPQGIFKVRGKWPTWVRLAVRTPARAVTRRRLFGGVGKNEREFLAAPGSQLWADLADCLSVGRWSPALI